MTEDKSESALGLLCPTCRVSLTMSERQGIEIDYCPQCRGVWLDRGELDKIIERSGDEEGQVSQTQSSTSQQVPQPGQPYPPQDRYDSGHGSGHGGGHGGGHGQSRRHGSFLGRLFD